MQQESGIEQINRSILQSMEASSDISHLLSDLAGKIGDLPFVDTNVDNCAVVSVDPRSGNEPEIGYWQAESFSLVVQKKITQHLSCIALDQYTQKVSPLLETTESLLQEILPTKTCLVIATQYQQKINGLILLFRSQSSEWRNSERKLLSEISGSIAIAISQIQLQQQVKTKAKYQSLFNEISREISQSSHPQSLFESCLAKLCNTLQGDQAMIVMLKYQNPLRAKNRQQQSVKGTARISCYWNSLAKSNSAEEEPHFGLGDSDLCQKAWHNAPNHLCFSSNTPFPDLTLESAHNSLSTDGSALLMVPLMGKKTSETDLAGVLGFLVLQYSSPHRWLEDEVDLINWVSIQLSSALVNHQTLNQVQSVVEERTAKLKWSLDVQAKLSTTMRHHIDQLQKLNELKDDFMNSMSHELKTPLTSMKIAIKMLRQVGISEGMREKYLNILEQEWNREYNLIKDLLTLQEAESGELSYSPQELNLSQTITELAQSFNAKWQPERGIKLKTSILDPNLKINTDIESLEHILHELLLNAAKYSDENTIVELSAEGKTSLKGKDIVIAIANSGAEIFPEELPRIFDKFRRGKGVTDRAVPGTGLGLALVQHLVEHLNGTIDATCEPVEQDDDSATFTTTFVLKLPQFQPSIS